MVSLRYGVTQVSPQLVYGVSTGHGLEDMHPFSSVATNFLIEVREHVYDVWLARHRKQRAIGVAFLGWGCSARLHVARWLINCMQDDMRACVGSLRHLSLQVLVLQGIDDVRVGKQKNVVMTI